MMHSLYAHELGNRLGQTTAQHVLPGQMMGALGSGAGLAGALGTLAGNQALGNKLAPKQFLTNEDPVRATRAPLNSTLQRTYQLAQQNNVFKPTEYNEHNMSVMPSFNQAVQEGTMNQDYARALNPPKIEIGKAYSAEYKPQPTRQTSVRPATPTRRAPVARRRVRTARY
jgi:hypothetical protein